MGQIKNIKLHIVTDIKYKNSIMPSKLKASLLETGESTVHNIRAEVDYSGDANVKQYFNVKSGEKGELAELKASFRGRPLVGKEVELPSGYQGFVVNKKRDTFSDQQDQTLYIEKKFDKFTCWNLEDPPSSNDPLLKGFDWMEVANVLHAPLFVDDEKENVIAPEEKEKDTTLDES